MTNDDRNMVPQPPNSESQVPPQQPQQSYVQPQVPPQQQQQQQQPYAYQQRPPQASMPKPKLQGKAKGAFVCGILSLVFCMVGIVGLVLGIIAIVFSSKIIKEQRPAVDGRMTAARVCGIIGVVLSVIIFIVSLAGAFNTIGQLMNGSGYTIAKSGSATSSASVNMVDDNTAIKMAVMNVMDKAQNLKDDSARMQVIADGINSNYKTNAGVEMKQLGVEPMTQAKWLVTDMTYTVGDITTDGNDASVSVTANTRDVTSFLSMYSEEMTQFMNSDEYKSLTSMDQFYAIAGSMLGRNMGKTGLSPKTFNIKLTKSNGKWVVADGTLDTVVKTIYDWSNL